MKISELETHLQVLRAKYGDMDVFIEDADTDWYLKVLSVRSESVGAILHGEYREPGNYESQGLVTDDF